MKAGVFSIVLEGIPWQIAKLVTETVDVPTIGIGAGSYCDGQILVLHDMLGIFTDFKPKFMKYFGNIGDEIRKALNSYQTEVKEGIYPNQQQSYDYPTDDLKEINDWFEDVDIEKEAEKLKKDLN